ncbi:glycosyltransferase [Citricoccus sp. SGAir0253]|uniref:bifunctional polysaccharide deacetylase/glycosyltransferase family 2 protein n=1 Tax=Citricoccus sp. SGAir0253 TaxID=2567881 RepID=UPI0010CD6B62|nr:bifunctional polysaccharide deacetylase/glycosyltransferase family 2 protein [Citricoccus sp. SGAir0253]QCU78042.1 glycosyltransferase [Citricoccus sp. SGAir0253]
MARRASARTGSTALPPVFFDPTGKRWRRILTVLLLGMALVSGLGAWLVAQAMTPPAGSTPVVNQDADYPRDVLATGDAEHIPILGTEANPFSRIGLVREVGGRTVLQDPFGDGVLRTLTAEEERTVGDSPYAMERFGEVPDKTLVLTFDDGPAEPYTSQILDILSAEGVPATFFTTGNSIVEQQALFRRILREGHAVGNHTTTHTLWDDWTVLDREELIATDRTMRSVARYESRLWRLPYGDPDRHPRQLLEAQQLGYLHVDFDLDTLDWRVHGDESVTVPELDGAGHVVLMHDGGGDRSPTVAAVQELVDEAKAAGYTFTTVDAIVPDDDPSAAPVESELADHTTQVTLFGLTVAPDVVMSWLFWFGIGSLTLMSALYVVLALVGHRRQRRRAWRRIPEEELPLVSVILPVFNEEPVVARTLDALAASDYPHLEVIAVDDGSTDRTLEILRDVARQWPQLRVLTQANGGKSTAINHGLMVAAGQIIVTLDGDTLFEPQAIRMLARHFHEPAGDRPVGAVAGHIKVGNRTGVLTMWQSLEYISGICVTRMGEGVAGAITIVPGACGAWNAEAIRAAGGYSHDTLAEDADLTMTLQELGWAVVQENEAVAYTEAPVTARGLARQRLRWTYGNLQALWKHAGMLFRPRYGFLGLVALPYAMLATVIPLLFLPLTILMAVLNLAAGNWQPLAAFGALVVGIHAVICVIAIWMVRESWTHLLIVPLYRVIYEPLRAWLLYASLLQALRGRTVGWYKPPRTNTVLDLRSMGGAGGSGAAEPTGPSPSVAASGARKPARGDGRRRTEP